MITRKTFSKWNIKKERSNRQVIRCSSYEREVKKQRGATAQDTPRPWVIHSSTQKVTWSPDGKMAEGHASMTWFWMDSESGQGIFIAKLMEHTHHYRRSQKFKDLWGWWRNCHFMSWHRNRSWGKTSLQPSLVPWSAKVSRMQVNSRDSRHNLVSPNSAVEVCYWIVQRLHKRNPKEGSFPLPSLAGTKTLCTIQ